MTGQITLRPWSAQPQHAGIWRVGIDHPGKLNAMSRAMWVALRETLQAVNARSDVRCLVVQGEGAAFCAGGDIAEYPGFRFDEAQLTHFHESEVWGGLQALLDCPVPVVAAIRGACMGAGVEISSCCDLRVATEDAKFGAPIARLGFPMAPRELELVGREVGSMVARRMLLEAAVFSAAEMAQHGGGCGAAGRRGAGHGREGGGLVATGCAPEQAGDAQPCPGRGAGGGAALCLCR